MGIEYLWDTNIAIYYLQQQFPPHAEKIVDSIVDEHKITFSAITEIELYSWKAPSIEDFTLLRRFVDDCIIIELDKEIKLEAAKLRRDYRMKLPDAIIAATSIIYDLTLITRNTKDFEPITNFKMLNPFDIF